MNLFLPPPETLRNISKKSFNTAQFRAFCACYEHGNLRNAGDSLYLTATAISKQIIRLENGLGVRLFTRRAGQSGGIFPTEAGTAFYAEILTLLNKTDAALAEAAAAGDKRANTLRIALPSTMQYDALEGFWADISRDHPSYTIEILSIPSIHESYPGLKDSFGVNIDLIPGVAGDKKLGKLGHFSAVTEVPYCVILPLRAAQEIKKKPDPKTEITQEKAPGSTHAVGDSFSIPLTALDHKDLFVPGAGYISDEATHPGSAKRHVPVAAQVVSPAKRVVEEMESRGGTFPTVGGEEDFPILSKIRDAAPGVRLHYINRYDAALFQTALEQDAWILAATPLTVLHPLMTALPLDTGSRIPFGFYYAEGSPSAGKIFAPQG